MTRTKMLAAVAAVLIVATAGVAVGAAVGGDANGSEGARGGGRVGASSPTENVFVPVTPCRLVDTRVAGGKLSAASTRNFVKSGNLVPQGGNPAGCGVPASASALEFTVTAVSAEGSGYLRLWPTGLPEPTATFMNYSSHFNVANAGTVAMSNTGFTAKAYARATHLVIDVLGYYVNELMAAVNSNGTVLRGNGVVSSQQLATGQYEVVFNRNVTGCAYTVSLDNNTDEGEIVVDPRTGVANGVFVQTHDSTGADVAKAFYVIVDC